MQTTVSDKRDLPGKRLALCLDGTWNKRSSNTNVFHLHNLIAERGDDGVPQLRYYDEGVGTGAVDYVTGGGFGFGLDENVIGAYEWLIENYVDGDEIYLFGFSRGAFTARSLVGLIMKCGLLRAGAPLTVDQLWDGYRILGRYREPDSGIERSLNWWERIAGRERRPFRSVIDLKWDTGHVRVDDLNGTERLLCEWSRRVRVHCVGVFDTVAAMGWDALAVPGLRTKIAAFHNTNPSRLMNHGLQALAIDEHRGAFKHVPWQSFTPHAGTPPRPWSTIEQRWFVGAHSNIGGGYEDNPLALFPLAWMVERLTTLGLGFRAQVVRPKVEECVPLHAGKGGSRPALRDSYAEFLGGVGRFLGSRNYRTMAPAGLNCGGYLVESINETIDPSVANLAAVDSSYYPPNYADYLKRHPVQI